MGCACVEAERFRLAAYRVGKLFGEKRFADRATPRIPFALAGPPRGIADVGVERVGTIVVGYKQIWRRPFVIGSEGEHRSAFLLPRLAHLSPSLLIAIRKQGQNPQCYLEMVARPGRVPDRLQLASRHEVLTGELLGQLGTPVPLEAGVVAQR